MIFFSKYLVPYPYIIYIILIFKIYIFLFLFEITIIIINSKIIIILFTIIFIFEYNIHNLFAFLILNFHKIRCNIQKHLYLLSNMIKYTSFIF